MSEKQKNHIRWDRVLATEGPEGDMIAQGLLDGTIRDYQTATDATPADLILVPAPFSLECNGVNGQFACADVDDIGSKEQAILLGWKDVEFDPFLLGSNYVGVCPQCQKEEALEAKSLSRGGAE